MKVMRKVMGFVLVGLFICSTLLVPSFKLNAVSFQTKDSTGVQVFIPFGYYDSYQGFLSCAGDLDNDNLTRETVWANTTHVYALNASGVQLWELQVADFTTPIIGDFDRDGYTDDVLSLTLGTAYNDTAGAIQSMVNGSLHYANFTCCNNVAVVGDFNGDGYADDIIAERLNGSYPYLCAYAYMAPGTPYWTLPLNPSGSPLSYGRALGGIAIGDLDEDGAIDDLVVTTYPNRTYALNTTGHIIWEYQGGGQAPASPALPGLAFADLDHDGRVNELLIVAWYEEAIVAVDDDGSPLWNVSLYEGYNRPLVGDIDHNGYRDNLAYVDGNEVLHALDRDGGELWNYTIQAPHHGAVQGVVDLNGNGYADNIVVGLVYNEDGLAFDSLGHVIGRGGQPGVSYFGDFDGDGLVDDYVNSYFNLKLWRFGIPQVQFEFLTNLSQTFEEGNSYWFEFNITNSERLPITLTFYMTTPSTYSISDPTFPVGTSEYSYGIYFMDSGTYNLTVALVYEGVSFGEVTVEVTVAPAFNWDILWIIIIIIIVSTLIVIFSIILIRRRKRDDI